MDTGYRLLEHTADMGLDARAESLSKVFEEMAQGLTMILFGSSPASARVMKQVILNDEDPVQLMVAWLNEVLYLSERHSLVPSIFRVDVHTEGKLRATLTGEPFNPQRHHVERQVKAVTYHQACLKETPEGWYARVYVDL